MSVRRTPVLLGLASLLAALPGCGAKTGLLIPDADMDASIDAPADAGRDAPCPDLPIPLTRTDVRTVFVLDRSGSMGWTWDGLPGGSGPPTRWEIVRDTLASVLPPFDRQLACGAMLFPDGASCDLGPGLDVVPHVGGTAEVLALFDRWIPEGGTPTAEAIRQSLLSLQAGPRGPAIMVLTTDGAPNCSDDPGAPPETCICTSVRRACLSPPPDGPRTCLDLGTREVVRHSYEDRGVPVVIVGIDDPSRPDFSDFLDELAIAGGWPRPAGSPRRFYDARAPEDLRVAFTEIANLIARCLFVASVVPPDGATLDVSVGGRPVRQDPSHVDGWDWTDRAQGALAIFGPTCDAIRVEDQPVTARVLCSAD